MPAASRHRRLLAILAGLAACDGANYVEGVVRWDSRDAAYGVQYITPPWEVASDDGEALKLQIAAELFGVALKGSPPTHVFTMGPVDASASLEDLLPAGLQDLGTGTSYEFDTTGSLPDGLGDTTGGLVDVDFSVPQEVALAELDVLINAQHADLSRELGELEAPGKPWMYEVVIPPGLFVRAYYYGEGGRTVRAMFASVFTLSDGDVDSMAQTITVGGSTP